MTINEALKAGHRNNLQTARKAAQDERDDISRLLRSNTPLPSPIPVEDPTPRSKEEVVEYLLVTLALAEYEGYNGTFKLSLRPAKDVWYATYNLYGGTFSGSYLLTAAPEATPRDAMERLADKINQMINGTLIPTKTKY